MEQTNGQQMQVQLTQQIDYFLKTIENDVRNSKTLTDIKYKKQCLSVCQKVRFEMYQIQLELVQQTKLKVEKALLLPETNEKSRQDLYETWQMVFDSMTERSDQIGGPIQLLLKNICDNDTDLKEKYSPLFLLGSGTVIMLLVLAVVSPVALVIPSLSPWLVTLGFNSVAAVVAAVTVATKIIYSKSESCSTREDSASVIDGSKVQEFALKLNDLVNTSKTEQHVWFSNELLENLLNDLKSTEIRLNELQAVQNNWTIICQPHSLVYQ
ncbi:unnamed protein product [Didymodactylos carnosus]|uniref:Uncharacterized protein n=1 Tax=Didymodactylos carnosus TaxID=1234261 RepID=A0A814N521_9BILA|nr:unnamed protein product [Didymodactylos carnosus]CAF1085640.1 unnamed protein product [Didymodactylos carnosus]CAF3537209.1 unnamed protein product [Didymodactylos carnosus]CAF3851222.1 unnamed protein product [Didymodactylos carnosus]